MANLDFIDLFHSFSCLWEVTSKEYQRREIRQAAMQSIAAYLPQEGEVSMTGERFKIRSGEWPYLSPMLLRCLYKVCTELCSVCPLSLCLCGSI